MKNSLLKTIYFPKNGQDILYLTDKLPKPSYDNDFSPIMNEKKLTYRAASESPNLFGSKETSSNQGSYKYNRKKPKRDLTKRSNGSRVSDTNEGSELPSVRTKVGHPSIHKKNTSSIDKLPDVSKPSVSSNKMSSVERIASRLEKENKSKPMMNIDKEYIQLQKILDRNQKAHDQNSMNVSTLPYLSVYSHPSK